MHRIKVSVALLCVGMVVQSASAQSEFSGSVIKPPPKKGFFKDLVRPYREWDIAPIDLANSGRLEALLRAGKIYLSLQDAIALALENDLQIAVERYTPLQAESDLLRAKAGGLLRGVPQSVQNGPSSAGGNFLLGGSGSGNTSSTTTGTTTSNGVITQLGPTTPNFDPVLQGSISWGHLTSPQTNIFSYGTNALVQTNKLANFSLSQGFMSGANAVLTYNNLFTSANTGRFDVNPYTTSSADLIITQPLLQGFGFSVNNRQIRVAKNNVKVADLTFKQQVITTVANVVGLYWDLVSLNASVKVARESLSVSEKLYNDNKKQVEIGTLAPIEIVRAEAEVAANQQNLTIAETNVLQQETIIKNSLSRNGVASPTLSEARIVPTDTIQIPAVEAIQPIQDLVDQALGERPELAEGRLNLENSQIQLVGSKNGLLPTISAFVDLTNHAQAGNINDLPALDATGKPTGFVRNPASVDSFFVGGYGTVLGQLFGRNFPDYRVGINVNIPLRNRSAEADYIRDRLNLRVSQMNLQMQINQIRVDVQNALIGLQQARARYQAALKQRVLEEQTLDAEQKKYALGASTIYLVIQTQRDLATAQSSEVTSLAQYARARVTLDQATGLVLKQYNVDFSEALKGVVSRPPSALPVLEPNGNGGQARR
jgi:outer membrane protein